MLAIETLVPRQTWSVVQQAWEWPLEVARYCAQSATSALVVRPLAWLYLQGPRSLGFWGGSDPEDICGQLTNTDADFWTLSGDNKHMCITTIERHFNSWVVLAMTATYFTIVVSTVYALVRRCCYRPQVLLVKDH
jgi:hypothetical protein